MKTLENLSEKEFNEIIKNFTRLHSRPCVDYFFQRHFLRRKFCEIAIEKNRSSTAIISGYRQVKYNLEYHLNMINCVQNESERKFFDMSFFSVRLTNVLSFNEIYDLRSLSNITRENFMRLRNCGPKCIEQLEHYMKLIDITFKNL